MSSTPTTAKKTPPNLPFPRLSEDLNRMVLLKYLPTPEVSPVTGRQHLNVDACVSIICQTRFGLDTWIEAFIPVNITANSPLLDAFSYIVPFRYLKPGQMNPAALLEIEVVSNTVLSSSAVHSVVMSGEHIPALIAFLNTTKRQMADVFLRYKKGYYGSPRVEELLIDGVKGIIGNYTPNITVTGDLPARKKWDIKLSSNIPTLSFQDKIRMATLHKNKGVELLKAQKYPESLGCFALAGYVLRRNIFDDPAPFGNNVVMFNLALLVLTTYVYLGRATGAYNQHIARMMAISEKVLGRIPQATPANQIIPLVILYTTLAMEIYGVVVVFEKIKNFLQKVLEYYPEHPGLKETLARLERRRDEALAKAKSDQPSA